MPDSITARCARTPLCAGLFLAVASGCATRQLSIEVRDARADAPLRDAEVTIQQITPGEYTINRFAPKKAQTDDNGRVRFSVPEVEWMAVFVRTEQGQFVVFFGLGRSVWTLGDHNFKGRTNAGERVPIEITVTSLR